MYTCLCVQEYTWVVFLFAVGCACTLQAGMCVLELVYFSTEVSMYLNGYLCTCVRMYVSVLLSAPNLCERVWLSRPVC